MTYFDGLELTADQKKQMIANFMREYADHQEWIEKYEDNKPSRETVFTVMGMQSTLVAMCEELDPENFYHRGKVKSRTEYHEEQVAMKAEFDPVAAMRDSASQIVSFGTLSTEPTELDPDTQVDRSGPVDREALYTFDDTVVGGDIDPLDYYGRREDDMRDEDRWMLDEL
jgi:hypothetical protein